MKELTRRDFIKASSIAGLAGAAGLVSRSAVQAERVSPARGGVGPFEDREVDRGVRPLNPRFPNIGEYVTLLGDFHQHSVFSDGELWPTARVAEAKREGLDVICISDHIEVRPFKADLANLDLGRAYELAKPRAEAEEVLLVPGLEITRSEPYAKHVNALFLKDFNALVKEKFTEAVYAAAEQEAFIFWNHPAWGQKEPKATWYPEMDEFLKEKVLHGFEVVNGFEADARNYQPEVMGWCQKHKVTLLGNSDAHRATAYLYNWAAGEHRPMTLLFAKERTLEGVREALFAGRTAVYYAFPQGMDKLIGNEQWLRPLFEKAFSYEPVSQEGNKWNVTVKNAFPFTLNLKLVKAEGIQLPEKLSLPPGQSTLTATVEGGAYRVKMNVLNFDIHPATPGSEERSTMSFEING